MKKDRQAAFRQIQEEARLLAASSAWQKAVTASALRKVAVSQRRRPAAGQFAEIKLAALRRVVELAPEHTNVSIDDEYHVGLVSVRLSGHGRLHLPADVTLGI